MKNKKTYIIIAIIVFIVVMIVPFLANDFVSERLRVSANLLSGLGSCITLIIAILLFNKYGIDKTIIDRKKEIVLDLLERIKKLRIEIEYKEVQIFYKPGDPFHTVHEEYYQIDLFFDRSFIHGLSIIFELTKNLYTPRKIIEKISQIEPMTVLYRNANFTEVGKVSIEGVEKEEKYGLLNSRKLTFLEFITFWDDLISECKNWLKENSGEQIELNIE